MQKVKRNIAGKFGPRYGARVRAKWSEIEEKQRKKQKCPYCKKLQAKRLAKGLWMCKACERKFTSNAYFLTA
ncbi:MAG: 50S ribosomal protein L37ae [Candidatus Pacearchaeota archaeon]